MNSPTQQTVDITPTPRILRTLGDIPFSVWQCLAELADNSIDAFALARVNGFQIDEPRIDIHWSTDAVARDDREIIVQDNGPGMSLEQLRDAAKAGYSSSDTMASLGLFGMGFNIATARLGENTRLLSTKAGSQEWWGLEINFDELVKQHSFSAPVLAIQKSDVNESGTKIVVSKLKDGVFTELRSKERSIRNQLESIYTPMLGTPDESIVVQGRRLTARPHCTWSPSRFVIRRNERIHAIQEIERDLGDTYFDMSHRRYLSDDEIFELNLLLEDGKTLPTNIVLRSRRLQGWIGIQRYADPSDFGIDFIRNGRKILVGDKTLFRYENTDTGKYVDEYPIELGSTIGGRIVGELYVDYLIPTYQKNSFDTTSMGWKLTVEAVRGGGPLLNKNRKSMLLDGENTSPLGKLVSGFRRVDPGTKYLFVPNAQSKELAKKFVSGDIAFQSDEKWYKIAQEIDRSKSDGDITGTGPDPGEQPSDDVNSYVQGASSDSTNSSNFAQTPESSETAEDDVTSKPIPLRDDLIRTSDRDETLSGSYPCGDIPGFNVKAWRMRDEAITENGNRVPYSVYQEGPDIDFFYDPTHFLISEYPFTAKQLLLLSLAERFSVRDPNIAIKNAFVSLVETNCADERINVLLLQERAHSVISSIRERLPELLEDSFEEIKLNLSKAAREQEDLIKRLIQDAPHLVTEYQSSSKHAAETLAYVGESTLVKLIEMFPEKFLDNRVFNLPYSSLQFDDSDFVEDLRRDSLGRILSLISEILMIPRGTGRVNKTELLRQMNTLSLAESLIS